MKITEITKSKLDVLREGLEADKTLTEQAVGTLMKIAEQSEKGTWSAPMSLQESLDEDARILAEAGIQIG